VRFLRLVSLGLLASAGLSCAADSDCGGPTSEWPACNNDSPGRPTGNPQTPDDNASEPKPSGGGKGEGAAPPVVIDGGASAPTAPSTGADAADGGVPVDGGGTDASVPPGLDGGASICSFGADAADAGTCFGLPCSLPQLELLKQLCSAGPCLGICSAPTP
jgi:hypothetical protein